MEGTKTFAQQLMRTAILLSVFALTALPKQVAAQAIYVESRPVLKNDSDYKIPFSIDLTAPDNPVYIRQGYTPFNKTALHLRIVQLQPCAVLAAHFHPHATEFGFVTKGSVQFGMFLEDGTRKYINYTVGDAIIVPQGTVHFVQNLACCMSEVNVVFDNPIPGGVYVAQAVAGYPADYLDSAFTKPFNNNTITGNTFISKNCQCTGKKKKCPAPPRR